MKISEENKKRISLILLGFLISLILLIPINSCYHKKTEKMIMENLNEIYESNNAIVSYLKDLKRKTDGIEQTVNLIEEKQTLQIGGDENSKIVYTTKYGECYHLEKDCISDPIVSTMNEAERRELRACSKCAY